MKVGILTQPINNNYGGILQNYALQNVLTQMGCEVVTLNWDSYRCEHNHETIWYYMFHTAKTFISKNILKRQRNYLWIQRRYFFLLSTNNRDFCSKYIKLSNWLWGRKQFMEYAIEHNLDALIVGSDQTWRPAYNKNGMLYRMFLDFAENLLIKRIAYSASFGVDFWEYDEKQTQECARLIHFFDSISVREKSGIKLCADHFDITNTICTLDPTMLLSQQNYIDLLNKIGTSSSDGKIMVYMLDYSYEKAKMVSTIAKEKTLECSMFISKYCNLGIVTPNELNNYILPSVDKWICAIYNAKYVICDSFHGMIFSIIFNKPFIVIGNQNRGLDRFVSLLQKLNLTNRLVDSNSNNYLKVLDTPINWELVNQIIKKMKEDSIKFLKASLDI
jgi:hypothetical protein